MRTSVGRLWAPWRSAFVTKPAARRCVFCAAKRAASDRHALVVARGASVFALLNLYPYNNGHLMIAPYRHVAQLERLRPQEWAEMLVLLRRLTATLRRLLHPQGFNIGLNLGRLAGAGIPGHVHVHLVPRWIGDTNFMTTIGRTKVISQSLEELYRQVAEPSKRRRRR